MPNDTKNTVAALSKRSRKALEAANQSANSIETELVRFSTGDKSIDFNIDPTADTVWATQQQIAELFGKDLRTVSEHIRNILAEGELDDSVIRKFRTTADDGKIYEVKHFDLDVILAVGHRAKSPRAAAFRKWANGILRSYLTKGYALNERRLKSDPSAADDLAIRLRAIRSEEVHVFAKVRDYFKEASTDYDGTSKACCSFYALLQDKFHVAASGLTACQLILQRANHREANMGLTTFPGDLPKVADAKIGKNYLSETELHILRIVVEQFLLYVESKAMRGLKMTMTELAKKFDELLRVNGYEVFVGYQRKDFLRDRADKHAVAEHAMYMVRQRPVSGVRREIL